MIRAATILATAAVALAWAGQAQAQGVDANVFLYGGMGIYNYRHTDREIPYFAEFPPVYYSMPVPRTYGYSPYAYPPTVMTPAAAPEPMTVENAYIPREEAPALEDRSTRASGRPEPLVVINPYFDPQPLAASESQ